MDAIYARQSIDKKGSLSIEGQIELCRKFTVDDALVFSDKGFSGKNTKRPAFGELMEAVEAGRVKKSSCTGWTASAAPSRISARSGSFCVKRCRISVCQRAVRHFLTDGTGYAQHCDDLCPA